MKRIYSVFLVLALIIVGGVVLAFNWQDDTNLSNVTAEVDKDMQVEANSLVADAPVTKGDPESVDQPASGQPAVAAGAYLLSGKKLVGWKTDKRWPVASVSKLVSAYVVEADMAADDQITLSEEVVATMGDAGLFKAGEVFSVKDMMKAMLMVSSNDAAGALADYYGHDEFVAEMNAAALRIGMANSHFVEPSGLSVQNQSTVEDLVELAAYILRHEPEILAITRQSTDFIVDSNTGAVRELVNINWFAGSTGFLGGKTGSLPEADGNLLSIFSVPGYGEPVIVVVLGSKDRFGETRDILENL